MKTGRPTDYSDEVLKHTIAFYERYKALKKKNVPTIENLAVELDVDEDTVGNWVKKHKKFAAIIRKMKTLQKARLMDRVMYKDAPPFGEIFLLNVNHKMIETKKKELTGEDGQPVRIEAIVEYTDDDEEDLTDAEIEKLQSEGQISA